MDGGFFLCPDAWEFLLPAGVRHLRDAGAVCRKRWDLLTLTPMGCALLPEPAAVTAAHPGRQRKKIPVTAVNPTAVNYLFLSGIQIRSRA